VFISVILILFYFFVYIICLQISQNNSPCSLTEITRYKLKKNPNILGNKYTKRTRSEKWLQERKSLIRRFLEQDVNSTMTPGKKDTITRGGVKKQKRHLSHKFQ
jgi:hypothetical protein